jgi:sporulation protein YqfC
MVTAGESVNYKVINLGGNSLYLEGIKSIVSFGESEMQFQLKKVLLIVSGEELKIKYLDKSTCVINGKIISVVTK